MKSFKARILSLAPVLAIGLSLGCATQSQVGDPATPREDGQRLAVPDRDGSFGNQTWHPQLVMYASETDNPQRSRETQVRSEVAR